MTDQYLLIVAAMIIGFLSEVVLQPVFVKLGWEVRHISLTRRVTITWPISSFIIWAVLYIAYTQYFLKHP